MVSVELELLFERQCNMDEKTHSSPPGGSRTVRFRDAEN